MILVVRGCIWNALVLLLRLPTFNDTGSLVYPHRRVVYRKTVSTMIIASHFLLGSKEVQLKLTTFSSFLLSSSTLVRSLYPLHLSCVLILNCVHNIYEQNFI